MRHYLSISLAILYFFAIGCKSSKSEISPIEVGFTYTYTASTPNELAFTASIKGNYDMIRWDFGDGTIEKGTSTTSHLFANAGNYTVTLSAWKGLEEFKHTENIVIAKNLVDFDFTYTPDATIPNIINFTAAISGSYEKVAWDFGNNTTDGNNLQSTATYLTAGTYKVVLTLWAQGRLFTQEKEITIAKDYLTIGINATPTTGNPYKYKLSATIEGPYDSLKWSFRSKESTKAETEAYFPFKGSYPVTLTVQSGSKTFTKTTSIAIEQSDPNYASNLKLAWSDEFDNSTLDASNWNVETNIQVNNELQTYTSSGNYSIGNGVLSLTCKKVDDNGTYGSYTSARLSSSGKKTFLYGRIEARLKLPKGTGTWPAFWMLGQNISTGTSWPKCGEIDIMEYVGADPLNVQGSLHAQDHYGSNTKNGRLALDASNDEGEWHVYGLIWQADKISFYVDDYTTPYYTYNAPSAKTASNWPYDSKFFVILNLAFGGDWGGYKGIDKTLDNMDYQIDWVRYYNEE